MAACVVSEPTSITCHTWSQPGWFPFFGGEGVIKKHAITNGTPAHWWWYNNDGNEDDHDTSAPAGETWNYEWYPSTLMVMVTMMVMRMIMIPQQVLLLDPLEPRLLLLVLQLEEVVPRCKLALPAVFNQIWPCCTWSCCTWPCCTWPCCTRLLFGWYSVVGNVMVFWYLLDRDCVHKCISVADGCFRFLSVQVTCCPCDMWVSH